MKLHRNINRVGSGFGLRDAGLRRPAILATLFVLAAYGLLLPSAGGAARDGFRSGEKLTYTISYDQYRNAGYAEIQVVSSGKIGGRDAVELRSKFKTFEFVAAAYYLIDESRTVFVAPDTGLPLYVKSTKNSGVFPEETISNFLDQPSTSYDLLSLIYRVRQSGGAGNFPILENGKGFTVTAVPGVVEKVKTDAGEFETTVSGLQSEFFTQAGVSDVRINFSNDPDRLPVLIRFRAGRGEFRISLAGLERAAEPVASPTPSPTKPPAATPSPTPKATPKPYIDDQPLGSEIPFSLGETLEFKIASGGQAVGTIEFQAKERRQLPLNGIKRDGLLLTATVTGSENGSNLFRTGDVFKSWVDPQDLQPLQSEVKFNGKLGSLNQIVRFDQDRGTATLEGNQQVQIPVNTHSLLSLFYAARSFNLRPSKDATNPVNDTRVAVLFGNQFYVFMLRPSNAQIITLRGEKVPAQLVTVFTGNPQLDALNIRFWLSNDQRRTPLRFAVGAYQADLSRESSARSN
ncbi:MAG: DUF3108 domain-containing protein [Acidobacteria bacterium]|nr:DUF3108 domain-containing protein [Acidobacteriota bacterium]